jgi:hypothetical protein
MLNRTTWFMLNNRRCNVNRYITGKQSNENRGQYITTSHYLNPKEDLFRHHLNSTSIH